MLSVLSAIFLSTTFSSLLFSQAAAEVPTVKEGLQDNYEDPLVQALTPVRGGLTAEEVAQKAILHSPSIGIKEAEITKAAAQLDQTIISYVPLIKGTASYTRLSPARADFGDIASGAAVGASTEGPLTVGPCPGGMGQCVLDASGTQVVAVQQTGFDFEFPLNSFSLQASLSIPLSDYVLSLLPARKGLIANKEATKLARDAEVVNVETDARIAYYNWLRGVSQEVVAKQSLAQSQARLRDAKNAFEAGVTSKADVLRLESVVASAESFVLRAEAFRQLSAKNLAVLMGLEETEDIDFSVGEDVLGDATALKNAEDVHQLVREAHQNRLEIRSLERNRFAIGRGIRARRADYFPRIDGFAEATYANPNQRFFPLANEWNASWSAGVQLTYTINSTLLTRARIKELKSDARKLELQAEALRRAITMEVTSAYLDRKTALASIEYNAHALEAAEEAYRVASELFKVGNATATDIIVAEVERVNAKLEDVNARINLRVANAKLLFATGRLKPTPGK